MSVFNKPPAERSLADWRLILSRRVRRLERLLDLAEQDPPAPRFLVSKEIDLVREALDYLDHVGGDRDTVRALAKFDEAASD